MAAPPKQQKLAMAGFDAVGGVLDQLALDQLITKPTRKS